mgnify:CR=1 FL=1
MNSKILPHEADSWTKFYHIVETNKLPHAFILSLDSSNTGLELGKAVAGLLFCSASSKPCQNCKNCKLRLASNHPDLKVLERGDDEQIKVEKVRDVINWATKSAVLGGIKLCLISAAEDLNIQAQNALLKVLEEPPAGTFFCLMSSRPLSLLSTVRSRCQIYTIKLPTESTEICSESRALADEYSSTPTKADAPSLSEKGGLVGKNSEPVSEQARDLICSIINGSISPFFGAGEIDRLSKSESLNIFYTVAFDAMVIQTVGLREIKCPALSSASELLSSRAKFDELVNIIGFVQEGVSISRGFSNINQSKLTERICNYIGNL